METRRKCRWPLQIGGARILPTRNGNQFPSEATQGSAFRGTDPTYKEWKLEELYYHLQTPIEHGSYLQGMETQRCYIVGHHHLKGTDPTYKEWKLYLAPQKNGLAGARILPTRNGNTKYTFAITYLNLCTDPTYKEWKLHSHRVIIPQYKHGSYLQGMETPVAPHCRRCPHPARILPTRNGNFVYLS